jgi:GNAT superfamily N-acetyltransferase
MSYLCQELPLYMIYLDSVASAGMTTVTLRTVAHHDIGALLTSVGALFDEDAGQHDSSVDRNWPAREGLAYYSGLVDDRACLLVLACDGDNVIGHLVGKLGEPNSIRTDRVAVLESMRVAPGSRRAGTGSRLVQHFLAWARQNGAQQASVTAYAANETAQRLYERHGFVPKSVTSRVALGPPVQECG